MQQKTAPATTVLAPAPASVNLLEIEECDEFDEYGELDVCDSAHEHDTLLGLGFPALSQQEYVNSEALRQAPARAAHRSSLRTRFRDRLRARISEFAVEERGAVTAEYALVILAAVAFAGLLITIMRSEEVRAMLVNLVQTALGSAG